MEDSPALRFIKDIQSGRLDPKLLSREDRQRCIEVLYLEGYSVAELADIIGKSDKTVRRDLEDIRKANSLSPSLELAKELIGEMVQIARIKQGRLERLAKSKEASVSERAQAEYLSWRVCREMMEKLSELGYLPSRPTEIVGDIYHHGSAESSDLGTLKEQILSIESTASEYGGLSPEAKLKIDGLKNELRKIEISDELKQINDLQTKETDHEQENPPSQNQGSGAGSQ